MKEINDLKKWAKQYLEEIDKQERLVSDEERAQFVDSRKFHAGLWDVIRCLEENKEIIPKNHIKGFAQATLKFLTPVSDGRDVSFEERSKDYKKFLNAHKKIVVLQYLIDACFILATLAAAVITTGVSLAAFIPFFPLEKKGGQRIVVEEKGVPVTYIETENKSVYQMFQEKAGTENKKAHYNMNNSLNNLFKKSEKVHKPKPVEQNRKQFHHTGKRHR